MKEAVIHAGPKIEIRDTPIPHPKAGQVVIKVIVSGSNPKVSPPKDRTPCGTSIGLCPSLLGLEDARMDDRHAGDQSR